MCGAVVPTVCVVEVGQKWYVLIPDVWGGCSNEARGYIMTAATSSIPDVWGGCSNQPYFFSRIQFWGLNPRCVGRLFQRKEVQKWIYYNCLNPRCVGRLFQLTAYFFSLLFKWLKGALAKFLFCQKEFFMLSSFQ